MRIRLALLAMAVAFTPAAAPAQSKLPAPKFQPEPFWPKPLPSNWILGQVAGIAVDKNDHVWIIHRPATLLDDEKGAQANPPTSICCVAAPPVLEFDTDGNLLKSWGGPGPGYTWMKNEHGIHVDQDGNVWVGGNEDGDQILKFTADGKFLQQIGVNDSNKGSMSTTRLGRPAHMMTDPAAGEIYVADGYGNRRVIVFDLKTGATKRFWGAYGTKTPQDGKLAAYDPGAEPSKSFSNPLHCVRLSNDGLLYVCDRSNDRIQVFKKDGTFVKEIFVAKDTRGNGSVWDLVLSQDPRQTYIFVADGNNGQIHELVRETGEEIATWGRHGRQPGQFKWVHNMAIDSKGNLYTSEVGWGRRVQKFKRVE